MGNPPVLGITSLLLLQLVVERQSLRFELENIHNDFNTELVLTDMIHKVGQPGRRGASLSEWEKGLG